MIEKEVWFEGAGGLRLHAILRLPEEEGTFPAIIVCHGFMVHKRYDFIIALANELSYSRFAVLRFDFLHHGESEGDIQKITISQEIEDVSDAIDFLETIPQVDRKSIGIIGHGLGGTVAILAAAQDKRLKAVATIAATAHIDRKIRSYFSEHQIKEWKRTGYIETGLYNLQRLKSSFLEDAYRHDVLAAVKKLKCPILVTHGMNDKRVPFENVRELYNHANLPKNFEIVEGASHYFFEPDLRSYLFSVIVDWFLRFLR